MVLIAAHLNADQSGGDSVAIGVYTLPPPPRQSRQIRQTEQADKRSFESFYLFAFYFTRFY